MMTVDFFIFAAFSLIRHARGSGCYLKKDEQKTLRTTTLFENE